MCTSTHVPVSFRDAITFTAFRQLSSPLVAHVQSSRAAKGLPVPDDDELQHLRLQLRVFGDVRQMLSYYFLAVRR